VAPLRRYESLDLLRTGKHMLLFSVSVGRNEGRNHWCSSESGWPNPSTVDKTAHLVFDLPMKLPGPFDIHRVIEAEGAFRPPGFLFPDATPEVFSACKVASDPRLYNADTDRLVMSFHSIVVRTERNNILVDTCVGNDKNRPALPEWHLKNGPYLKDLAATGTPTEAIDYVLCTHLHADHVGWNTRLIDGRWTPTFPNAKYIMARKEVEYWEQVRNNSDEEANHRSWDDSVQPIIDANQAVLVDDGYEIEAGVQLVPAPGHTPGNVMLSVDNGKERAFIIGDTLHHPVQVEHPEWSSRFCWDSAMSRKTRQKFLEIIADSGTYVLPAHFATPTAARIFSTAEGFDFEMVDT